MKIQPHNYLGLMFTTEMRERIFAKQKTIIDEPKYEDVGKQAEQDIANLLNDDNNVNYLMTAPSLGISHKIRIDEDKFDYKIFRGLTVGKKITILINNVIFYRYLVTPTGILCIWVTMEIAPQIVDGAEHKKVQYTTFKIDTEDGSIFFPNEVDPFKSQYFKWFLQQIIFLEFSDLETVTLKPNMKVGTKKQGNYLNGSKHNVVIVDSTWNKIMIRAGEFAVQGHLRLQPYGVGREHKKLIYISEFTKNGYVRNAKKQSHESKQQEVSS